MAITRAALEARRRREAEAARLAGNAAGGVNRWADADPKEAADARRRGGANLHAPANLARRLAAKWQAGLPDDERVAVLAELDPILDELLELAERARP